MNLSERTIRSFLGDAYSHDDWKVRLGILEQHGWTIAEGGSVPGASYIDFSGPGGQTHRLVYLRKRTD